jgi:hypothetical protein
MSVYGQLIRAHQDELLRAAAPHRLAAQARRSHHPPLHHPIAAAARRLVAMRCLCRLFS